MKLETDRHTVVLDGAGASPAAVGGKAAMLDRLIGFGAPVPACGVVTTAAYHDVVADPVLRRRLDGLRRDTSTAEDVAMPSEIDVWFRSAAVPAALEASIVALAYQVGGGGPIAVRSSATAEDLAAASFAGQYHTSLGVSPDEVMHAVRRCWASLWYPGPRQYRRFQRVDDADVAMAVLLMPMLEPTWAGVIFTEDPFRRTAMRVEMVRGLGEGLVSGARTPEVALLERDDVTSDDATRPWLARLGRLALDLERRIGMPLDVEWAVTADDLVLLQARPITGRDRDDEPDDDGFDVAGPDVRYTTAGIGEMLPGILPPRLWEANSWLVEEGFRTLFRDLGAPSVDLADAHALVGRIRGRAALDLDRMERVVESVPGGSSAELEHEYFGELLDPVRAPTAVPASGSRLVQGVRTVRARGRAYRDSELVIQAIDRVLDLEPELGGLTDRELLALRGRLLHLGQLAMSAEIGVAATASASYRGLEIFLRDHLPPDEATAAVQQLTQRDRSGLRGHRALDVGGLARRLADEPSLARVRTLDEWPDARAALEGTPAGRRLVADFTAALRRAGSTSVFGGPTWDEIPELVWPMLRALAAGPERSRGPSVPAAERRAAVLAELERRLAGEPRWRFTRWTSGQLVDVRRRFLRREASDAAAFLVRREHTKAALLMLGGVLWRVDREVGRRLEATGSLDRIGDVDLLGSREIEAGLGCRPPPLVELERRRRRLDLARLEPPLERVFRGRPRPERIAVPSGDRFTGWSGSPGWFEGMARVVDNPRRASLRRGEVLVARTTDASWLPLFHVAGAVVVEEGGPLSHAAILARELAMPAVINVPGIIDRVIGAPGCSLAVDGTSGEVIVHAAPDRSYDPAVVPDDTGAVVPGDGVAPPSRAPRVGDPNRLGVFVTGLIGASALLSVAIGLTQAIGSARTQQRISKRARMPAAALAAGTVSGYDPAAVGRAGLRYRGYYAWLAIVAFVVALLSLWMADDYVEDPDGTWSLWQLTIGSTTAISVGAVAVVAARGAARWPVLSPAARRLSIPQIHERLTPAQLVGGFHASVAAAMLLGVFVIGWFVVEAESELLVIDRWIFDRVGAGSRDNWWYPSVLDDVLRKEVMIPLAVVLTFATYRCRPLLVAYPLVITAAGMLHLTVQHFVRRDRPELGLKPGFDDAFPGGHANEVTLMLGLLPLVVFVLTRRRWLRVVLEVLCALALVLVLANQIRVGDHWPSDNLAGFLIGASMVAIARGVARTPALHERCRGCPAQERAPNRPAAEETGARS